MPDVSIIIVSYNVEQLLLQCISSIAKYFPVSYSYELVVVDNNSKDNSVASIRNSFPRVTIIENKFNNGFSGANNQGITASAGEIIFLLNPDTELTGKSMEPVFEFVKNKNNAIAAPRLLNSDGSVQLSCFRFPVVLQVVLESLFLHTFINIKTYPSVDLDKQCRVDALSGAALVFKRTLIDANGMLDENLFWMEDIDFCYRNHLNGGSNYYLPQSAIIHHSGQSSKRNYSVSIANQVISKLKYFKKHSYAKAYITAVFFSYLHVISRIIFFLLLSPFKSIYQLKLKAYLFTLQRLTADTFKGKVSIS